MPGRKFSAGSGYRYGFNGKETDNEVKGEGAQYDYGFRIYDPRLGKFLSVDPLFGSFPWYTTYQFAGNKPTIAIDLDGLEEYVVINYYSKTGRLERTNIVTLTDKEAKERVEMQLRIINKDGSLGELAAKGKKVLVRHVYSSNENKTFKNDEQRNSLIPREAEIYRSGSKVRDSKENPFAVQIKEGKDLESERDDYTSEQFAIEEKTKTYPPPNVHFQGTLLQSNKIYNFENLGVYLHQETPPNIGIQDARSLARALANTGINQITIQPYIVDGSGGAAANTVMGNGKTQQQNLDANYQVLGRLIQQESGVRVNVLPSKIKTTTNGVKPLEVKTQ